MEDVFFCKEFFFSSLLPDILNGSQCDETKFGFPSGTIALKKNSVTPILKCCEEKTFSGLPPESQS